MTAGRQGNAGASDVIVLGAGIVGVSIALHLQARGLAVLLVDRGEPGSETSHGNAGLVERASVVPYAMPRDIGSLALYALNRSPAVRYAPAHLPRLLPWLARYWWQSSPRRLAAIGRELLPLIEASIREHEALLGPSGAGRLMRSDGWIEIYRSARAFRLAAEQAGALAGYGLIHEALDADALKVREPALANLAGAVHWRDPTTSSDPGEVTRSYARLFVERGGTFMQADAMTLAAEGEGFALGAGPARWAARRAVIAMGPWSSDLCARLGYPFPVAHKRGYHMHYAVQAGGALTRPVCDPAAGFVLAPMARGIRLTTGIELAERDAPSDTRQLRATERIARKLFPLGRALDPEPWRGSRPCLPDMKPIIGEAPRHPGLWFAFGHAHHGFTLGPATGRLLAEMMTGRKPFADPLPFAPGRYLGG